MGLHVKMIAATHGQNLFEYYPESRISGAYNYDNMQRRCSFVRQRRTVKIDGLVGGDSCYLTHTCMYMRVCLEQRRAEAASSSLSSSVWSETARSEWWFPIYVIIRIEKPVQRYYYCCRHYRVLIIPPIKVYVCNTTCTNRFN